MYYYKQYRIGEIADLLVVCTKTVKRILARYDETGTVDPTEQWHGPERTLDTFAEMTLVQSVMSKPNVYLDELQSDLYSSTGITVSLSTICRTFPKAGVHEKEVIACCIETIRERKG